MCRSGQHRGSDYIFSTLVVSCVISASGAWSRSGCQANADSCELTTDGTLITLMQNGVYFLEFEFDYA